MALSRFARNRKGSSDVTILSGGRFLLAGAFIILIIFPFFGRRLLGFVGGSDQNAFSIDKGFADLIAKVNCLNTPACPDSGGLPHTFSVDSGFYLVSFNAGDTKNGKAVKPPDCKGIACFCVCTDETCQKIDASKNRGRDCRPIAAYQKIVVQGNVDGNKGGLQLYIKGEQRVSIKLSSSSQNELDIAQQG